MKYWKSSALHTKRAGAIQNWHTKRRFAARYDCTITITAILDTSFIDDGSGDRYMNVITLQYRKEEDRGAPPAPLFSLEALSEICWTGRANFQRAGVGLRLMFNGAG